MILKINLNKRLNNLIDSMQFIEKIRSHMIGCNGVKVYYNGLKYMELDSRIHGFICELKSNKNIKLQEIR